MSDRSRIFIFVWSLLLVFIPTSLSQTCSKSFTFGTRPTMTFKACVKLPTQQASLAWSYESSNNTLSVVFSGVATSSSGWVGWGINLGSQPVMIGSNALVAFRAANGSNMLDYKLTAETQADAPLKCSPIDLVILDRAVNIQDKNMNLYAVIQLKPNHTKLNHVWNRGPGVTNFIPQAHSQNTNDLNGRGVFDITSGTVTTSGAPHQKLKNAHGFLNAVGWGILLPIGAMSARYLRMFHDPGWFYLHVFCQSTGYILGVSGFGIGLKLGSYSAGVRRTHRNIGITLFVFGTLQVLAMVLRPGLHHRIRPYWNVYHHTIGYLTLLLAFINIYKGLNILQPRHKWRNAYTGILVVLAIIAAVLEVTRWTIYFKKRRAAKAAKPNATNGRQSAVEL